MRLQKNTLLALYSTLEFARDPARHIAAAEIAERYGVSSHHLAKVLAELARSGMVESVRGAGGGYRFAGNARRITLMDIIQMFEDFAPSSSDQAATPVDLALGAVLSEIDENAKATFNSITVATMLRLIERQQASGQTTSAGPSQAGDARSEGRRRGRPGGSTSVAQRSAR